MDMMRIPPLPLLPPSPAPTPPPWQTPQQLRQHLARLLDNVALLKALADELEAAALVKAAYSTTDSASPANLPKSSPNVDLWDGSSCSFPRSLLEAVEAKGSDFRGLESLALEAATSLQQSVESQLAPLLAILQGTSSWEEAAAVARMSDRQLKARRNRQGRRRRRQRAAEALRKERERYDQADQEADEWRAREIAKDIARRKMEKMKEVAKKKAKEDSRKLEEELELVLIVEKLQELRSLRIQRLKKQGSFFPEEDNRFMERVRAAVEEEERQAAAAADTNAAAAAIANAEDQYRGSSKEPRNLTTASSNQEKEGKTTRVGSSNVLSHHGYGDLPPEFYHYYHGSSVDMGTLIEARRTWDIFILPGGSRIPGHWVEPPAPADAVWASCLLKNDEHISLKRA